MNGLTKKEIKSILEQEIGWCNRHDSETITKEYRYGFIKGLEQALYLLTKAISVSDDDNFYGTEWRWRTEDGAKAQKGLKR